MGKQGVNKSQQTLMTQMYPPRPNAPKVPKQGTRSESGRVYGAPKDQQQGKLKPLF